MPRLLLGDFSQGLNTRTDPSRLESGESTRLEDADVESRILWGAAADRQVTVTHDFEAVNGNRIVDAEADTFREHGPLVLASYPNMRPRVYDTSSETPTTSQPLGPPIPPSAPATLSLANSGTEMSGPLLAYLNAGITHLGNASNAGSAQLIEDSDAPVHSWYSASLDLYFTLDYVSGAGWVLRRWEYQSSTKEFKAPAAGSNVVIVGSPESQFGADALIEWNDSTLILASKSSADVAAVHLPTMVESHRVPKIADRKGVGSTSDSFSRSSITLKPTTLFAAEALSGTHTEADRTENTGFLQSGRWVLIYPGDALFHVYYRSGGGKDQSDGSSIFTEFSVNADSEYKQLELTISGLNSFFGWKTKYQSHWQHVEGIGDKYLNISSSAPIKLTVSSGSVLCVYLGSDHSGSTAKIYPKNWQKLIDKGGSIQLELQDPDDDPAVASINSTTASWSNKATAKGFPERFRIQDDEGNGVIMFTSESHSRPNDRDWTSSGSLLYTGVLTRGSDTTQQIKTPDNAFTYSFGSSDFNVRRVVSCSPGNLVEGESSRVCANVRLKGWFTVGASSPGVSGTLSFNPASGEGISGGTLEDWTSLLQGAQIKISGTQWNDGSYTLSSLAGDTLTFDAQETCYSESGFMTVTFDEERTYHLVEQDLESGVLVRSDPRNSASDSLWRWVADDGESSSPGFSHPTGGSFWASKGYYGLVSKSGQESISTRLPTGANPTAQTDLNLGITAQSIRARDGWIYVISRSGDFRIFNASTGEGDWNGLTLSRSNLLLSSSAITQVQFTEFDSQGWVAASTASETRFVRLKHQGDQVTPRLSAVALSGDRVLRIDPEFCVTAEQATAGDPQTYSLTLRGSAQIVPEDLLGTSIQPVIGSNLGATGVIEKIYTESGTAGSTAITRWWLLISSAAATSSDWGNSSTGRTLRATLPGSSITVDLGGSLSNEIPSPVVVEKDRVWVKKTDIPNINLWNSSSSGFSGTLTIFQGGGSSTYRVHGKNTSTDSNVDANEDYAWVQLKSSSGAVVDAVVQGASTRGVINAEQLTENNGVLTSSVTDAWGVGVPALFTPGSAGIPYQYRYSYLDARGLESAPSEASGEVLVDTADDFIKVTLTLPTYFAEGTATGFNNATYTDEVRTTKIRLYRVGGNYATWSKVTDIDLLALLESAAVTAQSATYTFDDTVPDASLVEIEPAWESLPPLEFVYTGSEIRKLSLDLQDPDPFRFVTPVSGVFMAGLNQSLRVSETGTPHVWPLTGEYRLEGTVTAIAEFHGEGIVFTEHAIYRARGFSPEGITVIKVPDARGLPPGNEQTLTQFKSMLLWLSAQGVCAFDGNQVLMLTRNVPEVASVEAPRAAMQGERYVLAGAQSPGYLLDFRTSPPRIQAHTSTASRAITSNSQLLLKPTSGTTGKLFEAQMDSRKPFVWSSGFLAPEGLQTPKLFFGGTVTFEASSDEALTLSALDTNGEALLFVTEDLEQGRSTTSELTLDSGLGPGETSSVLEARDFYFAQPTQAQGVSFTASGNGKLHSIAVDFELESVFDQPLLFHSAELLIEGAPKIALQLDGEDLLLDGYPSLSLTPQQTRKVELFFPALSQGRVPHVINLAPEQGRILSREIKAISAQEYGRLRQASWIWVSYRNVAGNPPQLQVSVDGKDLFPSGRALQDSKGVRRTERVRLPFRRGEVWQWRLLADSLDTTEILEVRTDEIQTSNDPAQRAA